MCNFHDVVQSHLSVGHYTEAAQYSRMQYNITSSSVMPFVLNVLTNFAESLS